MCWARDVQKIAKVIQLNLQQNHIELIQITPN